MNFKIITLPQTQICLHRDISESGQEIVRISTFVVSTEGKEPMLEKIVKFSDAKSAQNFIKDYSETSAQDFVKTCLEEERITITALH
jgi:hypothetical protein